MKLFTALKISIIASIAMINVCCTRDDINDKSKRNENWVWWVDAKTGKGEWIQNGERTTVDSGLYTFFYANGMIREKGKMKGGINTDTIFVYDYYGKLAAYIFPDSTWYYYYDGIYRGHYPKGQLREEGIVKDHRNGDKWKYYSESGSLLTNVDLKNDTGWITHYYPNGRLKDSAYVRGKEDQLIVKQWYENGNRARNCDVKNGFENGVYITYYEHGQLKDSVRIVDGKQQGKFIKRYSNGALKQVSLYQHGVADGPAISYYENGQVKTHVVVKNGIPVGRIVQYNEDGSIKFDTVLKK